MRARGSTIGWSLLLSGWATAMVAGLWVPRGLPEPHPGESGLLWWPVAIAVVIAVWVARAVLRRRRRVAGRPAASDGDSLALLGVAALACCAALAVWAGWGLVEQLSKGWAGYSTAVSLVGAIAGVVGAALLIAAERSAAPGRPAPVWTRVAAALVPAVAVAAVAALLATTWAPTARLTATTAPAIKAPALPEDLTAVAWRTEMPTQLHQVIAAGPGVVALVDDGLVALDGTTGKERWSHRREGAVSSKVDLSPDGRTLLLTWSAGAYGATEFVFLDATTGAVLHQRPRVGAQMSGSVSLHPMSRSTFVLTSRDEDKVAGFDLRTGDQRWQYALPSGCSLANSFFLTRTDGPAILPLQCGEDLDTTVRFVAFGDGPEPVWEREFAAPQTTPTPSPVSVRTSADGSVYHVTIDGTEQEVAPFTLDYATGRSRPYPGSHQGVNQSWSPEYDISTSRRGTHSTTTVKSGGRTLGTVPSICPSIHNVTPSDELLTCLTWEPGKAKQGTATIWVNTFAGGERSIEVDTGGPYTTISMDPQDNIVVRAPGAWVVWQNDPLADGATTAIVGLR